MDGIILDILRASKKRNIKTRIEEGLVSIIIPTYNYGRYLLDSIESALNQTYPNVEVIVVDDGSTDDTKTIANSYPIKYVFQNHQGAPVAMNTGVKLSNGEFFITLGADDVLGQEYIAKTLEPMLKNKHIGFVYTGVRFFGDYEDVFMPRKLNHRFSILVGGWPDAYMHALGASLIRRIAFENLGGGYDPTLPAYEDLDLCTRLCLKGWKAKAVFEPLYFWRRHSSETPHRHPGYDSPRDRYYRSLIDRKFWYRRFYRKLLVAYNLVFERFLLLIQNPMEYLMSINKKWKVMNKAKLYPWHNLTNRKKAVELAAMIASEIDGLVHANVAREPLLSGYHKRRLAKLETDFLGLMDQDAGRVKEP